MLYDPRMLVLRSSKLVPLALAAAIGLSAAPARAEGGSRWVAALPFGVGQFQNGDVGLGAFFAAGEVAAGAVAIASVIRVNQLADTNISRLGPSDMLGVNRAILTAATANRVAFTAWAALTVAGVIEAQVSFRRRERPLRAMLPLVAPVPGGALLAVQGTF